MLKFNKTISCITRYMDRFEFLKQSLPTWLVFPYEEIIIVDWSSKKENIVSYIKDLNDHRIKLIQAPKQQFFNAGAAWNVGIRFASSEFINGIDCDVMIKSKSFSSIKLEENVFYTGIRTIPVYGSFIVCKKAWQQLAGFTEMLKTWSHEDVLFYDSLEQAGYKHIFFDLNDLQHINHSNELRFENFELKLTYDKALKYNQFVLRFNKDKTKIRKSFLINLYEWKENEFVCNSIENF